MDQSFTVNWSDERPSTVMTLPPTHSTPTHLWYPDIKKEVESGEEEADEVLTSTWAVASHPEPPSTTIQPESESLPSGLVTWNYSESSLTFSDTAGTEWELQSSFEGWNLTCPGEVVGQQTAQVSGHPVKDIRYNSYDISFFGSRSKSGSTITRIIVAGGKPGPVHFKTHCAKILKDLMDRDYVYVFPVLAAEHDGPVDPPEKIENATGVFIDRSKPGYVTLQTVKAKLEAGGYQNPAEFERDVTWSLVNCFQHNLSPETSNNPIVELACSLLGSFEQEFGLRFIVKESKGSSGPAEAATSGVTKSSASTKQSASPKPSPSPSRKPLPSTKPSASPTPSPSPSTKPLPSTTPSASTRLIHLYLVPQGNLGTNNSSQAPSNAKKPQTEPLNLAKDKRTEKTTAIPIDLSTVKIERDDVMIEKTTAIALDLSTVRVESGGVMIAGAPNSSTINDVEAGKHCNVTNEKLRTIPTDSAFMVTIKQERE